MPTATAISIDDGQATPVSHTFSPQRITPSESTFVDKSSLTSAGQNQLILGFSPSSASRQTDRIKIRLNLPTETTVDGITSVAYVARSSNDIILPSQMTLDERKDAAALIANAIQHAIVKGYIEDLDPVY
jgi:hypothetical protein